LCIREACSGVHGPVSFERTRVDPGITDLHQLSTLKIVTREGSVGQGGGNSSAVLKAESVVGTQMESVGSAEYGTGMQRHAGFKAIHTDPGMAELYRLLTLKMVT
jgi:hypothetical protein